MRILVEKAHAKHFHGRPGCELLEKYSQYQLFLCDTPPAELTEELWQRVDSPMLNVNGNLVKVEEGEFRFDSHPHTLVSMIGPIKTQWLHELASLGLELKFICPPYGACMRIPDTWQGPQLAERCPFVTACQPYVEQQCQRPLGDPELSQRQQGGMVDHLYDLVLFSREDKFRISDELKKQNVDVLDSSNYKLRIRYKGDTQMLRNMAGVKLVNGARPTQLASNTDLYTAVARPLPSKSMPGLRGRDQVIAVADTGLDTGKMDASLHPDFQGRVKAILSLPLAAGWQGFADNVGEDDGPSDKNSGHGTHVAGLALGNGARSRGQHQGVAPEAQLVFQAIEQYTNFTAEWRDNYANGYYLSGRPLDLRKLFLQAREYGARIHVNAWGDEARGNYTDDCWETDDFLHNHPDALILFAAGNSGADRDGNRIIDIKSIFSPAVAKNCLAIGATEGGIEGVGLRVNWGAFDRAHSRFRASSDRSDPISGDSDRIALFSSAGPSSDGRIKPDLCAPGTNLVAPRSRLTSQKGWGLAAPLPYYMYNGGTSMATGVAGGAAAVAREAWQHQLGRAPSGTALKALLILSCRSVHNRKTDQPEPGYVAGFGRLQIDRALPFTSDGKVVLHDDPEHALDTGEVHEFPFHLNQPGQLRAVLCWYDVAGDSLINNLNLCLVDGAGQHIWGNHGTGQSGQPDSVNNVELIDQPQLESGHYCLKVIGTNVPLGPQNYSLAISLPHPRPAQLPLKNVRGISTRLAGIFAQAGVKTTDQLLTQPQLLESLTAIPQGTRQILSARLLLLREICEKLSDVEDLPDMTLKQLLLPTSAERATSAETLALKDLCTPLILVFNKHALSRIPLSLLAG